ncbi:2-dehydro-3-deoxygalactonokinase [Bowmanella dokdonensis]|uniref:2-dehydro-3-deoxygalactonokinase n=1 Tax=Bowmanella dokdonensis TaxID=751969 RepID=A0A939DR00_9ALTE|nr:2-dehydro-3-deoxygalactonokinase [Bowmanella dokdonensis]MBN7827139.1 2-dehydro-3-deoxygalactonokinase [Bowmanella dokdonensis]
MTLLAIDWGSSSFRAWHLDNNGQVLAQVTTDRGVLTMQGQDFAEYVQQICGSWRPLADKVLMAGMVGSRNGWQEVPYLPCPAAVEDLSKALVNLNSHLHQNLQLVPGLQCTGRDGMKDVMRGEETQIIGALHLTDTPDALLCLPGTHSKWAKAENGAITEFSTFFTGELFAQLTRHSSLAGVCNPHVHHEAAFMLGLEQAGDVRGLLHLLFRPRAAVVTGQLEAEQAGSFLSGLVIGSEILGVSQGLDEPGLLTNGRPLLVVGSEVLNRRYQKALEFYQLPCRTVSGDMAVLTGLHRLATSQ